MSASDPHPPRLRLCPGGPMLVYGQVEVETEDGVTHESTRPVSAVCRCGATGRAPWCDGTHRLLGRDRARAAARSGMEQA